MQRSSRRAVVVEANLFSRFARVISSYANTVGELVTYLIIYASAAVRAIILWL